MHKALNQKEDSLEEFLSNFSKDNSNLEVDRLFHSLEVKPAQRIYTYHKTDFVSSFKCGDLVHFNKVDKKGFVQSKVFPCQSVKFRNKGYNTLVDTDGKEYNLKYCSLIASKSLVFV